MGAVLINWKRDKRLVITFTALDNTTFRKHSINERFEIRDILILQKSPEKEEVAKSS